MVALTHSIETYDFAAKRRRFVDAPQFATKGYGSELDLEGAQAVEMLTVASPAAPLPLPAGMFDQELSDAAADQMENILHHGLGQPTRPAGDLPSGNLSRLLGRHR